MGNLSSVPVHYLHPVLIMLLRKQISYTLFIASISIGGASAKVVLAVDDNPAKKQTSPFQIHSPAINGFLGLNTIPSARMDETGTIRAGISTLDPYLNSFISVQIAKPLSLTFRQTAEVSSLTKDSKALYPGVDFKLRLFEENTYRPEIALGIQSALGHKRMAGEYLTLSKRYKNLDFTTGLGWGRFGTAGHFKNPLIGLSPHFKKDRDYISEYPNEPSDWFTGKDAGIFGGMEVFLPYDGFSLKFDYGADRYTAEKMTSNYHNASPWGTGLAYNYQNQLSAGIGIQGTDKVMGRLSIQSTPAKWPFTSSKYSDTPRPIYKERPQRTYIARMRYEADLDGIKLSDIWIDSTRKQLFATLHLPEKVPAPKHVGRAVRHIIANAQDSVEEIIITLQTKNLRGTRISLMRSDIEKALHNKQASANEIWQHATIKKTQEPLNIDADTHHLKTVLSKNKLSKNPFLPAKHFSLAHIIQPLVPDMTLGDPLPPSLKQGISYTRAKWPDIRLILDNQIGLSEEDSGFLRRSSLIIKGNTNSPFLGFSSGAAVRLNLSDNLDNISKYRAASATLTASLRCERLAEAASSA